MVQSHFHPCPQCNKQISVSAQTCPLCGFVLVQATSETPEQMIVEVPGDMLRGLEEVGGKLKVTNHRLIFKPHAFNIQNQQTDYALSDVAEVSLFSTLGVIPNGVQVTLKSGSILTFTLLGRKKLIEALRGRVPVVG